jgi:RNA polymerase sigma factor (sigma-70 family)
VPLPFGAVHDRNDEAIDAEQAYRRHSGRIYRHLLHRTGNHHDAEELTQQVFTDAAAALSAARPPESLLSWLYTVAERRLVDELRRRKRFTEFASSVPRVSEGVDILYGRAVARGLRDAIAALPPDQREVVVLKVLEGRRFTDIAARLGVSEAACKMRMSRAARTLRAALEQEGLGR